MKSTKNRICYEIKSETITTRRGADSKTYIRDDVYCVSQALGHNRLDVIITHYLSDYFCSPKDGTGDIPACALLRNQIATHHFPNIHP